MEIKILGSHGSIFKNMKSTCIQLSEKTLIDAGNIIEGLGKDCIKIDNILLTHAHLDHIIDIAFLIDFTFKERTKPLNIYGHKETLDALKNHIMNWDIWPEFSSIRLLKTSDYAINYIDIKPGKSFHLEDMKIYPYESNHSVKALSYIIYRGDRAILFTGDTHKNSKTWEIVNKDSRIKAVITDVSFPSYMDDIAYASKHNTPETLEEDMENLKREDIKIYAMHIKPFCYDEVIQEIEEKLPHITVLKDGDYINV